MAGFPLIDVIAGLDPAIPLEGKAFSHAGFGSAVQR
jgi:hypothetical protein